MTADAAPRPASRTCASATPHSDKMPLSWPSLRWPGSCKQGWVSRRRVARRAPAHSGTQSAGRLSGTSALLAVHCCIRHTAIPLRPHLLRVAEHGLRVDDQATGGVRRLPNLHEAVQAGTDDVPLPHLREWWLGCHYLRQSGQLRWPGMLCPPAEQRGRHPCTVEPHAGWLVGKLHRCTGLALSKLNTMLPTHAPRVSPP